MLLSDLLWERHSPDRLVSQPLVPLPEWDHLYPHYDYAAFRVVLFLPGHEHAGKFTVRTYSYVNWARIDYPRDDRLLHHEDACAVACFLTYMRPMEDNDE